MLCENAAGTPVCYLYERNDKTEEKPDINHLDIGGLGESIGHADEPAVRDPV